MIATSFYCICMCLITIYLFINRRKYDIIGSSVFLLFTIESVFSVLMIKKNVLSNVINYTHITFGAYILLIIALVIYISPFFRSVNEFDASKYTKELNSKYWMFAYIYIICAIVTILVCLPTTLRMVAIGNWAESYGQASVNPYSNIIEYFATNFCDYLRVLALLVGFAMIRGEIEKKRFIIPVSLIAAAILTSINHAILSTSRSMIYETVLIVLFIYIFFFRSLEKNKKRFFTIAGVIVGCAVVVLFMNMTISRFQSRGTSNFMLSYLGQAPVVFNAQVVGSIDKLSFGKYAWGTLFSSQPFNQNTVGGSWGARFYMFTGWIYIDWGILGLIIIGLVLAYIFRKMILKREYVLSDLYLIFSFLLVIIKGIFVIGRMYSINLVATILIYFVLKIFFDKYTLVLGKYRF